MNKDYKILLVDDEPDILEIISYSLESEGYSVCKANNGLQAIEVAEKEIPDLIIMDLMMPKMNGVEAIKAIMPSNPNSKIIVCSSVKSINIV